MNRLHVENWHKLNCRLVWAYEGPVRAKFKVGAFRQEAVPAWLIRRGWVRMTFGRSTESCEAGNWYFPKAGTWRQEFSPDAEILSMRFIAQWPDTTSLFDRSKSLVIPVDEAPRLTAIARRLARYTHEHQMQGADKPEQVPKTLKHYIDTHRLFLDWMTVYVDLMEQQGVKTVPHQPLDDRVWLAVNQMERTGLHTPLRENELARLAGLSKSHLNRIFVGNMGMTPAEYWEQRRISAARSALLESERSVKTIAYELGFNSLSHFSSWVKKKLGRSPRDFRRDSLLAANVTSPARPAATRYDRSANSRGAQPLKRRKHAEK